MLRKWEEPLDPPNARHHPSPKAFSVHPEGGSFAAQRHKTSELLVFLSLSATWPEMEGVKAAWYVKCLNGRSDS